MNKIGVTISVTLLSRTDDRTLQVWYVSRQLLHIPRSNQKYNGFESSVAVEFILKTNGTNKYGYYMYTRKDVVFLHLARNFSWLPYSVTVWMQCNTCRGVFAVCGQLQSGNCNVKRTYTGCPRRNVPDFGRVFLMLKYTDRTQNTYVQSWTVTEIMATEVWNFDSCYKLVDYQIHIKTGRNMWFL